LLPTKEQKEEKKGKKEEKSVVVKPSDDTTKAVVVSKKKNMKDVPEMEKVQGVQKGKVKQKKLSRKITIADSSSDDEDTAASKAVVVSKRKNTKDVPKMEKEQSFRTEEKERRQNIKVQKQEIQLRRKLAASGLIKKLKQMNGNQVIQHNQLEKMLRHVKIKNSGELHDNILKHLGIENKGGVAVNKFLNWVKEGR